MNLETLEVPAALERGRTLPFACVRTLSAVTLGKTPVRVGTEELSEAYFFSRSETIHLFRTDGGLRAARLWPAPGEEFLEECYAIDNPRFGAKLTVRRYLAEDEDGQVYVAAALPADWEEARDGV